MLCPSLFTCLFHFHLAALWKAEQLISSGGAKRYDHKAHEEEPKGLNVGISIVDLMKIYDQVSLFANIYLVFFSQYLAAARVLLVPVLHVHTCMYVYLYMI